MGDRERILPSKLPLKVIHRGRHGCGFSAVLLSKTPPDGGAVRSAIAYDLMGEPIPYQARCVCGSCGAEFMPSRDGIRQNLPDEAHG